MPLFSFTYGIDCVKYDPVNPSIRVRAPSLRAARKKAQRKLNAIVAQMSREKWVLEGPSWESKDQKWVHYPATKIKGRLYPGFQVKRRRVVGRFAKHIRFPVNLKAAEAMASVICQPLLQVIEQAPVFADRFSKSPSESGPFIPLKWVGRTVYSPPPGWVPNNDV